MILSCLRFNFPCSKGGETGELGQDGVAVLPVRASLSAPQLSATRGTSTSVSTRREATPDSSEKIDVMSRRKCVVQSLGEARSSSDHRTPEDESAAEESGCDGDMTISDTQKERRSKDQGVGHDLLTSPRIKPFFAHERSPMEVNWSDIVKKRTPLNPRPKETGVGIKTSAVPNTAQQNETKSLANKAIEKQFGCFPRTERVSHRPVDRPVQSNKTDPSTQVREDPPGRQQLEVAKAKTMTRVLRLRNCSSAVALNVAGSGLQNILKVKGKSVQSAPQTVLKADTLKELMNKGIKGIRTRHILYLVPRRPGQDTPTSIVPKKTVKTLTVTDLDVDAAGKLVEEVFDDTKTTTPRDPQAASTNSGDQQSELAPSPRLLCNSQITKQNSECLVRSVKSCEAGSRSSANSNQDSRFANRKVNCLMLGSLIFLKLSFLRLSPFVLVRPQIENLESEMRNFCQNLFRLQIVVASRQPKQDTGTSSSTLDPSESSFSGNVIRTSTLTSTSTAHTLDSSANSSANTLDSEKPPSETDPYDVAAIMKDFQTDDDVINTENSDLQSGRGMSTGDALGGDDLSFLGSEGSGGVLLDPAASTAPRLGSPSSSQLPAGYCLDWD